MVPDFRAHRGVDIDAENRILKDIQEWVEAQRTNALDLYQEIGEEPPIFPGHLFATVQTNVDEAAIATRDAMDFSIDFQMSLTAQQRLQFPDILRRKIERLGILTLKNNDLRELGARGMCLVEFPLPVVVFHNEAPSAQAFTLIHELAHVLRSKVG